MKRKISALIIDDSRTTRHLIIAALQQTGLADFAFTEAEDGVDGLKRFDPDRTQIIFVDLNMPHMDGVRFTQRLREEHKHCPPIVMITAEERPHRLKQAEAESGVAALLLKPVDRDRLRQGLKMIVDAIPEPSGVASIQHGECVPVAVREVLGLIGGFQAPVKPVSEAARAGSNVVGLFTVSGQVAWHVTLGFSCEAAELVASRLAGCELPFDHPDLGDAVGEITNIVGGRLKLLLHAKHVEGIVSFPTVVRVADYEVLVQRHTTARSHEYDCPRGRIWTRLAAGIGRDIVL